MGKTIKLSSKYMEISNSAAHPDHMRLVTYSLGENCTPLTVACIDKIQNRGEMGHQVSNFNQCQQVSLCPSYIGFHPNSTYRSPDVLLFIFPEKYIHIHIYCKYRIMCPAQSFLHVI